MERAQGGGIPLLITATAHMLAPDSIILSCPEQRLSGNWLLSVLSNQRSLALKAVCRTKAGVLGCCCNCHYEPSLRTRRTARVWGAEMISNGEWRWGGGWLLIGDKAAQMCVWEGARHWMWRKGHLQAVGWWAFSHLCTGTTSMPSSLLWFIHSGPTAMTHLIVTTWISWYRAPSAYCHFLLKLCFCYNDRTRGNGYKLKKKGDLS